MKQHVNFIRRNAMSARIWYSFGMSLVAVGLIGCEGAREASPSGAANGSASASPYLVDVEPAGAIAVGEARQSVEHEDDAVVIGRIGGSVEPFIDGLAAFTIVDLKVPHCAAEEGCPTPWDYCCKQDQVQDGIAVVKVVDEQDTVIAEDARQLLGVGPLDVLVVQGEAQRDEDGNLTLLADRVFVRQFLDASTSGGPVQEPGKGHPRGSAHHKAPRE
jgi:hypothetical protein